MIKNLIIKTIVKAYPNFFLTQIGFNFLYNQKIYKVNFVNDHYIYKSVENGYSLLYGELNLAGEKIFFNNFNEDISNLQPHLLKKIHSFNWLQDLKAVENETASLKTIELFSSWIDSYGSSRNNLVFNEKILTNRIFNWLTSSKVINFSDEKFRSDFYSSLSFQIRFLLKTYKFNNSIETVSLCKTLFVISRAVSYRNLFKIALDGLVKYLDNNLLSDGGNNSKCPNITFNHLVDIVFIYKNLTKSEEVYKSKLRTYIDKIVVFIKSLRYEDGGLAIFYAGYEENNNKIDFILSLSSMNASPFHNLRYSGYLSLSNKKGINIFLKTAGYYLKSDYKEIDNSILSNEVNIRKERIFVNNSSNNSYFKVKENIERNNYSTMMFYDKNGLINMPAKLNSVDCKIEHRVDPTWNSVITSYKGLKNSHGLIWHKSLFLEKKEGNYLLGEELLTLNNNNSIVKAVSRFIMHPKVTIKDFATDKKSIFFEVDGEEWLFRSTEIIEMKKDSYRGIRGEIIPNIILDIPVNLKNGVIEWSLIQVYSIVNQIKNKSHEETIKSLSRNDKISSDDIIINEEQNNQHAYEEAINLDKEVTNTTLNDFMWEDNQVTSPIEDGNIENLAYIENINTQHTEVEAETEINSHNNTSLNKETKVTNKEGNLKLLQAEKVNRGNNSKKNKDNNYIFLKLDL